MSKLRDWAVRVVCVIVLVSGIAGFVWGWSIAGDTERLGIDNGWTFPVQAIYYVTVERNITVVTVSRATTTFTIVTVSRTTETIRWSLNDQGPPPTSPDKYTWGMTVNAGCLSLGGVIAFIISGLFLFAFCLPEEEQSSIHTVEDWKKRDTPS